MHRQHFAGLVALLAASAAAPALAQTHGGHASRATQHTSAHSPDSLATHRFELLADGARIEVQAAGLDSAAVGSIRSHLRAIADGLASGDATPFAHMSAMPAITAMLSKHDKIRYAYTDLPAGAEIRFVASDAEAVRAIHLFVACGRLHHTAQHHVAQHDGAHQAHNSVIHAAREHDAHEACGHSGG